MTDATTRGKFEPERVRIPSEITARPHENGDHVEVFTASGRQSLTAQEAYDLHQALGAILPQLVQPFKPYPRD